MISFFNLRNSITAIAFLLLFLSCNTNTSNKNPIIAHRGAWKLDKLPENSIASLKKAIELKCYGSEFDVHLTKDNIMVVNHDNDYMGLDIESSTYQELIAYKLSNDEQLPTLKNYLKVGLKQNKTKLILEIKSAPSGVERTLQLTRMAVELVHNLNGQPMVEYICFNYDAGLLIKELDPKAKVAYLNGDKSPEEVLKAGYTGINYNYKIYQKNSTWIKKAQDLGLTTNSWTVNKEEDMEQLLKQKINYITTNEPELLFRVLNN